MLEYLQNGWQGIVFSILIVGIIISIAKNITSWIKYGIIGIIILQALFILGQTSFNNLIPIRDIFKYDIFTSLGNLMPGTFIQTAFTAVGEFLSKIILLIINLLERLFGGEIKTWNNLIS